jgi:hypothetical protein
MKLAKQRKLNFDKTFRFFYDEAINSNNPFEGG